MKVLSFDTETSISKGVHGSTFRDSSNDTYTQIFAAHPDNVKVVHNKNGFKRRLCGSQDWLNGVDVIIGHNIGFDLSYIWHDEQFQDFMARGGRIHDTQVAEYLLTGQQHKFSSLAELQLKYLGTIEKPGRISALYKKGIGADKIVAAQSRCPRLWALYNHYCRLDGSTPLRIFKAQYMKAKQDGMLEVIQLYNEYLLCLINMSVTGIGVDVIKCEQTLRDFNLKYIETLQKIQDLITPLWDKRLPEFNINSVDHKSAILFGGYLNIKIKECVGRYKNGNERYATAQQSIRVKGFGVPPSLSTPLVKQGFYATPESLIREISVNTTNYRLQEYCKLQRQAMFYKKMANTYCQGFLNYQIKSKIHGNFNNTATETGRLSSSEPNLQNVPKKNEIGKLIHSLLTAPPGWRCVSIDFSQLEVWCLALLSGDEVLLRDLQDGVDFHCVRVTYLTNKTYEEVLHLVKVVQDPAWILRRSQAKSVGFSMQYGGGAKGISSKNDIPIEDVEKILEEESKKYPKASAFGKYVLDIAEKNKKISRALDIPSKYKSHLKDSFKIHKGLELLPIFDNLGNVHYNTTEFRGIGVYQSLTGRKYNLLETGRILKNGTIKRSLPFTHAKNYCIQGTAGDIQAATTTELLKALLTKADKIKMVNEIHDSKWFYVREDTLKPCLHWLRETIENVPKIFKERFDVVVPFKFPVEIEVGNDFGAMEKYNE